MQVHGENSFTHPTCILSSFSQNASQILLPKRLSKRASTISFRKYKQKLVLLVIYLFNYDLLMQLSSCRRWLQDGFCQINKLEFYVSCNTFSFYAERKRKALQEYPSFWSACMFWYVLFNKNLIVVLHHGDNAFLFYFYVCIKSTLSTII